MNIDKNMVVSIFLQMISMRKKGNRDEICGFFYGKGGNFNHFHFCKNSAKNRISNFQISFWEKIKFGFNMIRRGGDDFITAHTHSDLPIMSDNDIRSAPVGSKNAIFCFPMMIVYEIRRGAYGNKSKFPVSTFVIDVSDVFEDRVKDI